MKLQPFPQRVTARDRARLIALTRDLLRIQREHDRIMRKVERHAKPKRRKRKLKPSRKRPGYSMAGPR